MNKRKFQDPFEEKSRRKTFKRTENIKKHSLDSDEEDDNDDADDILHEDDIEGEEEGGPNDDGEIRMTAFNMREELEEGHFDGQGHFIWKNEKEVKDNWLDNIDWQQIKSNKSQGNETSDKIKGLGEESDSDDEDKFDELGAYKKLIQYLQPNETVSTALRRLGGKNEKLSSIERLRRKKAGTLDTNPKVTELTELANSILTALGNMDVYQESYKKIKEKINNIENKRNPCKDDAELDMYADDFDDKEKEKLDIPGPSTASNAVSDKNDDLQWEYKIKLEDEDVLGPFTTKEMINCLEKGTFKSGAWARKVGVDNNFYSINRIDFELYLC